MLLDSQSESCSRQIASQFGVLLTLEEQEFVAEALGFAKCDASKYEHPEPSPGKPLQSVLA